MRGKAMSQIHVTRTMTAERDASQFFLTTFELGFVMVACIMIGTLFGIVFGMAISAGPHQHVAEKSVAQLP